MLKNLVKKIIDFEVEPGAGSNPETLLCLVRSRADIDQIVPILWKARKMGYSTRIVLACTSHKLDIKASELLQFCVESLGCELTYYYKLATPTLLHRIYASLIYNRYSLRNLSRIERLARSVSEFLQTWNTIHVLFGPKWLDLVFCRFTPSTIFFDRVKNTTGIYGQILPHAKSKGIHTIQINHAPPAYSWLISDRSDISGKQDYYRSFKNRFQSADQILLTCESEKELFVKYGVEAERIKVVGTPRYTSEWIAKLPEVVGYSKPEPSESKPRILVLEHQYAAVEPYQALFAGLRTIENVELKLLCHPRLGKLMHVDGVSKYVADGTIHSSYWLRWADIVLFVASGVAIEALHHGKTCICTSFLNNFPDTLFQAYNCCIDAKSVEETIALVVSECESTHRTTHGKEFSAFKNTVINGGLEEDRVLENLVDIVFRNVRP